MTYRFIYIGEPPDHTPLALFAADVPALHALGFRLRDDERPTGIVIDGARAGDLVAPVHEAMGRAPTERITRTLLVYLLWRCAERPDAAVRCHYG